MGICIGYCEKRHIFADESVDFFNAKTTLFNLVNKKIYT